MYKITARTHSRWSYQGMGLDSCAIDVSRAFWISPAYLNPSSCIVNRTFTTRLGCVFPNPGASSDFADVTGVWPLRVTSRLW